VTRTFALVREFREDAHHLDNPSMAAVYLACAERLASALHEDLDETLRHFQAAQIKGELMKRLQERHVMPLVVAVALATLLAGSVGCASNRPPDLEPGALPIWQANEVQAAFGTLQQTAISLNAIERCDEAVPPVCEPLLSDDNTRVVIGIVRDVVLTLRAVPSGWLATANAALTRLNERLSPDAQAKLAAYINMVRDVTGGL